MEVDVTPTFPTFIGRFQIPDADAMNHELRGFILAKEAEYARLGHSNIGGGHSSPDVFHNSDPSVVALTTWVSWTLNQMIGATAGPEEIKGVLSLSAWAAVCRAGAYHAPHSHRDSAWSGVYYVDAGVHSSDRPLSGVHEFLDLRAAVEAVSAPGDPYGKPLIWPRSQGRS